MKCAENLLELYVDLDDFLKIFLPEFKKRLISNGQIKRNRATQMSESEIIACHPKRTGSHKVFKNFAAVGMSSMGWFYGFKLHLICNHRG